MAGYIGSKASVVSSGAEHKKVFDITTTTTSLTGLVYTPTLVHVFHNGVRLVDGTDYTATSGTTITLTVAAENGDQVVVISYATFQTSDTVSASAGGTFGNNVSVTGTLAATAVTGDGSGLTSLTSANLTGALPAISGAALTSLTSSNLTGALPAISGAALTSLTSANLTGALPAISGAALTDLSGTPTGALLYFAASTAPTGFIKANGASLDTTTYADLFAIVGYTYGGSGASFTLPDLRGEFMRGWDDARGVDSGRAFGSAQTDVIKAHKHLGGSYGIHDSKPPAYGGVYITSQNPLGRWVGTNSMYQAWTSTDLDGVTGGTETRPRNVALLACIKY